MGVLTERVEENVVGWGVGKLEDGGEGTDCCVWTTVMLGGGYSH